MLDYYLIHNINIKYLTRALSNEPFKTILLSNTHSFHRNIYCSYFDVTIFAYTKNEFRFDTCENWIRYIECTIILLTIIRNSPASGQMFYFYSNWIPVGLDSTEPLFYYIYGYSHDVFLARKMFFSSNMSFLAGKQNIKRKKEKPYKRKFHSLESVMLGSIKKNFWAIFNGLMKF